MNYVLFVGSRLGFESLKIFINKKCDISHVFIEKEHEHENEKYYEKLIDLCELNKFQYTVNSTNDNVQKTILRLPRKIDYIMTFGIRKIIPKNITNFASIAALGTHFSPLPRYRGFAPLNWVLINGESETAVNLFYLDQEVDNGDIIDSKIVTISYQDDINSLYEKCLKVFKEMMVQNISNLETQKFTATKQNHEEATYTCSRNPEDGLINWYRSSNKIYNLIRALTYPYPGAFTYIENKKVIIWKCEEYITPTFEGRVPGKVIKIIKNRGAVVLCGEGAILLKEVQLENDTIQTADKVFSSLRLTLGQ